eukprot:TRINITY_DN23176_c0_g1_i1.p1 TRINITY_DN23176_c0_g1~~TRINITY_DN23176_c0_g1_i1.p1  ORF type:complete len:384 (+),score=34.99 TRINITY_DN23176_c0_g1_i1:53-1153(+)
MAVFSSVVFVSLQAVTVLFVLDKVPWIHEDPVQLAIVGGLLLVCIGFVGAILLRLAGATHVSFFGIFFTVTAWSACIDLVLTASLLGLTRYGSFYMEHGEEYFKTAWGVAALAWDGTAHYILQVYLAWRALTGQHAKRAGLFWAGSIIQSMPVLLLGAATGHFSTDIKPSIALNCPYVLIPIVYVIGLLSEQHPSRTSEQTSRGQLLPRILFAGGHASVVVLHVWRSVVVLGCMHPAASSWINNVEPVLRVYGPGVTTSFGFVRVQILQAFFYHVPWHAWAVWRVLRGQGATLASWALLFLGAEYQSAFTYVSTALFRWNGVEDYGWHASVPLAFYFLNGLALVHSTCAAVHYQSLAREGCHVKEQ